MTATTERTPLRERLLEACIAKQKSVITDFKSRIKSLLQSEDLGNEEAYDNTELANTSQKMREVNSLNEALVFANMELEVLENLRSSVNEIRDKASFGAIVTTDQETFFISTSIDNLQVDDQNYIGLSMQSPLFHVMNGKTKGERFSYNDKVYKIVDVF